MQLTHYKRCTWLNLYWIVEVSKTLFIRLHNSWANSGLRLCVTQLQNTWMLLRGFEKLRQPKGWHSSLLEHKSFSPPKMRCYSLTSVVKKKSCQVFNRILYYTVWWCCTNTVLHQLWALYNLVSNKIVFITQSTPLVATVFQFLHCINTSVKKN